MLRRIMRTVSALLIILTLMAGAVPAMAAENDENSLGLTEEEQAYIASCGTLKVGFVQDRIPVSFTGAGGSLAGVSRYIFDRIQRVTGLTFEYVPLPGGSVTYDYLMDEGLALVTSVEYNEENQHARGILMSDPYFSSRKVVVARQDLTYSADAALTVAVSSGSQTLRKVMADTYPNYTLVDYDTIGDCFDAVRSGKTDVMIINQYVAEYWLTKPSYENMKVIPVLGMDDELCFSAVVPFDANGDPADPSGRVLIDILDKAIAQMPEDVVGSYIIQAVMENRYTYTVGDFLYRYRYAVSIFICSFILVAFLLVLLTRQHIQSVRAQADARAKSQFLSTMSHEIRTPLNGLIGLNYLMGRKLEDKELLTRYLDQSTTTAKYLLSLVSDILDMSLLHNEDVKLDQKPVDLETVLSAAEAIVRSTMAEKNLDFHMDVQLPQPWVIGDGVRIQQVLLNLLDNAAKFTPPGGSVTVTVRQTVEAGVIHTDMEVADTGKGMSEEFRRNIFDAFAQERDTVSKGDQGVGLGLAICHRLVKLMDGKLDFVSAPEVGSVFTFSFPAHEAQPVRGMPDSAAAGDKGRSRILVAEDNELNSEIMLDLLTESGYEADLAPDGQQALDLFAASAPGTYGFILMDLLMPVLDGFAAAAAIRALDRPDAGTVRIIACSANCTAEDRHHALDSGMDGFLAKPIDMDELFHILNS